jgi:hypothetical protein
MWTSFQSTKYDSLDSPGHSICSTEKITFGDDKRLSLFEFTSDAITAGFAAFNTVFIIINSYRLRYLADNVYQIFISGKRMKITAVNLCPNRQPDIKPPPLMFSSVDIISYLSWRDFVPQSISQSSCS